MRSFVLLRHQVRMWSNKNKIATRIPSNEFNHIEIFKVTF